MPNGNDTGAWRMKSSSSRAHAVLENFFVGMISLSPFLSLAKGKRKNRDFRQNNWTFWGIDSCHHDRRGQIVHIT
ncbi:hypothetical protein [Shimia sp. MIT910701]|jgi:hypothetical protein|uniref:hypothetical protein n=1 Tax=Shimia sp. MIT910701 TaxID=3096987 RepID=UPI00399A490E